MAQYTDSTNASLRFEALKKMLEDQAPEGLDLICVDPLSHFGGPDFETDNGQASALMRKLDELTKLKGNPTVLAVHHSPKGAKNSRLDDALRGSSALKDNSRWVGVLRRVAENDKTLECKRYKGHPIIELIVAKSNYTKNGLRVRFALEKGAIIPIEEDDSLNPSEDNVSPDEKALRRLQNTPMTPRRKI